MAVRHDEPLRHLDALAPKASHAETGISKEEENGLGPVRRGEVVVRTVGPARRAGATPRDRIDQGLGMVSEDRKQEGLALAQSVADNLTYSRLNPYSWLGWLRLRRRDRAVRGWLERLRIRCSSPEQAVGELSGGNQQKVALGRLLHQQADVLLLDEPTRGVDVGSKVEIYHLMNRLTAAGAGIIMISSELPELLGMSDRIMVMHRGRIHTVLERDAATEERVVGAALGLDIAADGASADGVAG